MIKIGILGDIGSGKSYVAQSFGYPVFDADREVSKLYKTDKKTFNNLKKILPDYFDKFPIEKKYVLEAILDKKGVQDSFLKSYVDFKHQYIPNFKIKYLEITFSLSVKNCGLCSSKNTFDSKTTASPSL